MKTNRQLLAKLIREADEGTLVFIRERLLYVCDQYPDRETVRRAFADTIAPIFSPKWADVYFDASCKVREALETESEVTGK